MNATHSSFTFIGHQTDLMKGEITFSYELKNDEHTYLFKDKVILPSQIDKNLTFYIQPILDTLLLVLGISYWKTFCPKDIRVRTVSLSREQADFWNLVYTKGLGEFYYKNHIDFRQLVFFPYKESAPVSLTHKTLSDRSLVLLGGGKDSIVTAKLFETHHKQFSLFTLNPVPLHEAIAAKLGREFITVKRILDPQLFDLNRDANVYNGHVPISAIYACMSLLVAALYDYRYIVASNEVSASYGNVEYLGQVVNHQWSKSLEFEMAFQSYVHRYVTPDIRYFSMLRPVHEAQIVKLFTKYPDFFPIFSSCNKNYKLSGAAPGSLWCGECPKCAFVFLLLAANLPKEKVIQIFGKNLFTDTSLLKVYRELLGLEGFKPFECVGTPDESLWGFLQVLKRKEYSKDIIIKSLAADVLKYTEKIRGLEEIVLGRSASDVIPKEFQNLVSSL